MAGECQRVSAVIFRDQDFDTFPDAKRLYDFLYLRLKNEIGLLYSTRDPYDHATFLLQEFGTELPIPGHVPAWQDQDTVVKRATLITAFVRRGCYYPYEALHATLQPTIATLAEEVAVECAKTVRRNVPQQFERLFTPGIDWWTLRPFERRETLLNKPPYASGELLTHPSDEKKLWDLLCHPKESLKSPVSVSAEQLIVDAGSRGKGSVNTLRFRDTRVDKTVCAEYENCKGNASACYQALRNDSKVVRCRTCWLLGGQWAIACELDAFLCTEGVSCAQQLYNDDPFRVSTFGWADSQSLFEKLLNSFTVDQKQHITRAVCGVGVNDKSIAQAVAICVGSKIQQRRSEAQWQPADSHTTSGLRSWAATHGGSAELRELYMVFPKGTGRETWRWCGGKARRGDEAASNNGYVEPPAWFALPRATVEIGPFWSDTAFGVIAVFGNQE